MGGINPPPRKHSYSRDIEAVQVCERLSSMNANIHLANVELEKAICAVLNGKRPSMNIAIKMIDRAMVCADAFDDGVAGLDSDSFQFGDIAERTAELVQLHGINFSEAAVVSVNNILASGSFSALFAHFQARARAIRENLSLVMDDFITLGERPYELTGAYQRTTAVCDNYTRVVTMANRLTEEWAYMAAVARMAVAISRRHCSRVLVTPQL